MRREEWKLTITKAETETETLCEYEEEIQLNPAQKDEEFHKGMNSDWTDRPTDIENKVSETRTVAVNEKCEGKENRQCFLLLLCPSFNRRRSIGGARVRYVEGKARLLAQQNPH